MVKTVCFHCRGPRFNPWLRNRNPKCCGSWPEKKKKVSPPFSSNLTTSERTLLIILAVLLPYITFKGLPWWFNSKESTCQCRRPGRHRFSPWVQKIPWRRAQQHTPEEPGRLQSVGLQRVGQDWAPKWFFLWSCMDVRVGLWRRLSTEELMLLNCGVGEDSWESLGLQGDPTSPFWRRSSLRFLWKEWC